MSVTTMLDEFEYNFTQIPIFGHGYLKWTSSTPKSNELKGHTGSRILLEDDE